MVDSIGPSSGPISAESQAAVTTSLAASTLAPSRSIAPTSNAIAPDDGSQAPATASTPIESFGQHRASTQSPAAQMKSLVDANPKLSPFVDVSQGTVDVAGAVKAGVSLGVLSGIVGQDAVSRIVSPSDADIQKMFAAGKASGQIPDNAVFKSYDNKNFSLVYEIPGATISGSGIEGSGISADQQRALDQVKNYADQNGGINVGAIVANKDDSALAALPVLGISGDTVKAYSTLLDKGYLNKDGSVNLSAIGTDRVALSAASSLGIDITGAITKGQSYLTPVTVALPSNVLPLGFIGPAAPGEVRADDLWSALIAQKPELKDAIPTDYNAATGEFTYTQPSQRVLPLGFVGPPAPGESRAIDLWSALVDQHPELKNATPTNYNAATGEFRYVTTPPSSIGLPAYGSPEYAVLLETNVDTLNALTKKALAGQALTAQEKADYARLSKNIESTGPTAPVSIEALPVTLHSIVQDSSLSQAEKAAKIQQFYPDAPKLLAGESYDNIWYTRLVTDAMQTLAAQRGGKLPDYLEQQRSLDVAKTNVALLNLASNFPVVGTVMLAEQRGLTSGYTIASIIGDTLFLLPVGLAAAPAIGDLVSGVGRVVTRSSTVQRMVDQLMRNTTLYFDDPKSISRVVIADGSGASIDRAGKVALSPEMEQAIRTASARGESAALPTQSTATVASGEAAALDQNISDFISYVQKPNYYPEYPHPPASRFEAASKPTTQAVRAVQAVDAPKPIAKTPMTPELAARSTVREITGILRNPDLTAEQLQQTIANLDKLKYTYAYGATTDSGELLREVIPQLRNEASARITNLAAPMPNKAPMAAAEPLTVARGISTGMPVGRIVDPEIAPAIAASSSMAGVMPEIFISEPAKEPYQQVTTAPAVPKTTPSPKPQVWPIHPEEPGPWQHVYFLYPPNTLEQQAAQQTRMQAIAPMPETGGSAGRSALSRVAVASGNASAITQDLVNAANLAKATMSTTTSDKSATSREIAAAVESRLMTITDPAVLQSVATQVRSNTAIAPDVKTAISEAVKAAIEQQPAVSNYVQQVVDTANKVLLATDIGTIGEPATQTEIQTAIKPLLANAAKVGVLQQVAALVDQDAAVAPEIKTAIKEVVSTVTEETGETKPPPPIIPIPKSAADASGELALTAGSLAWKMGWTWKYIPPPWDQKKPISLPRGVVPAGARIGGRTPRETVQMIGVPGSKVPKSASIDLGVVDVYITNYGRSIRFGGHGEETDVGKSLGSTTTGMTINEEDTEGVLEPETKTKRLPAKSRAKKVKRKNDWLNRLTGLGGLKRRQLHGP